MPLPALAINRSAHRLIESPESVVRGFARAKVNLTLRVLGRMSSGLHRIESLLVPISLGDDVQVRLSREFLGVRMRCDLSPQLQAHVAMCVHEDPMVSATLSGLAGGENLAAKAAEKLLQRAAVEGSTGAEVSILKRVPFGAGLGGGSADAATTLVLLSRLLGDPLGDKELYRIAEELGADVPAMLFGEPVAVAGVGELLFPLAVRPQFSDCFDSLKLVVVKPPFGSPTAAAYAGLGFRPGVEQDGFAAEQRRSGAISPALLKEIHGLGFVSSVSGGGVDGSVKQLTLSGPAGICLGPDSPPQGGGLLCYLGNAFQRTVVGANPRLERLFQRVRTVVAAAWVEAGWIDTADAQCAHSAVFLSGSGSALVGLVPATAEMAFEERIREVEPGAFISTGLSVGVTFPGA